MFGKYDADLDLVLGIEDSSAERLPDVVDDLLPVGDEGWRTEFEVALESLLPQPADSPESADAGWSG